MKEGNVLKVDSFLNHQMDIKLLDQMGAEFKRRFAKKPINKILTIEASGIGIACVAAQHFDIAGCVLKKSQSINLDGEMYVAEVESFTHKCRNHVIVSQKFLTPEDHVLIIDDFLANGCALQGLIQIVQSAGATVEGIGIAIEKRLSVGRKDHPQPRFSAWSLWQSLTEWMLRRGNGDVSQPGRAQKRRSSPREKCEQCRSATLD